jgi:hypothetical protein
MTTVDPTPDGGEAGHIVLVVDAALLPAVQESCRDLVTALASAPGCR